jgi:signal transduction histidine kinase
VLTAIVTASGSDSRYDWLEAIVRASMVGIPLAVGLFARHRPPFERFGTLLLAAGVLGFLGSLAAAGSSLAYSLGRVSIWALEVWFIYLVLAFPTGRLSARVDRLLVLASGAVVVFLYLPTALLVEQYPLPALGVTCDDDCPANAFMVVGSEPAFVDDVVRPLREVLTIAILAAATMRLGHRLHRATRLTRITLQPVLAVAMFRLVVFASTLPARRIAPRSEVVEVLIWLLSLAFAALAVAFLVGLIRWRLFIGAATQRLAARLRGHPRPAELRSALAEAFDDPTLEIAYWIDDDERWADADGNPVNVSEPGDGRWRMDVLDEDRLVAAITCDAGLRDDQAFPDTATSYAVMTLNNQRLSAQTASLLREVGRSRARILRSADDERRRIERDLHDGTQQRLVALRIKLALAADRLDAGDERGAELLRGLGDDVEAAIDEVRSLAHGIYPAALVDRGLVNALRSAALRAPLPTTLLAHPAVRRYSREIESAAYFCCLEALQNVAKHAAGATAAVIEISDDGALELAIRDDGAGFDTSAVNGGVGLTSMRDRLAAVGGVVEIQSSYGRGTRVLATIPLEAAAST